MASFERLQESCEIKNAYQSSAKMEQEFTKKSKTLQELLKSKFEEMHIILKVKEKLAETILHKNLQQIEMQIKRIKKVPHELFENTDIWNQTVTQLLEDMDQNQHEPNFISYELLDQKKSDPSRIDILEEGEKLID